MSETYKNMNIEQLRKAAEDGDVEAQLALGDRYRDGEDIEQDYQQAVYWYRMAAEQGNAEAQNRLGVRYSCGQGVDEDQDQAEYWWTKAAEQGCEKAIKNLFNYYEEKFDSETSALKMSKVLEVAGENCNAETQYQVGVYYYRSIQDMERAVFWYRKSAEQGYSVAQCQLGELFLKGKGVEQSIAQAMEWYQKAAEQGDVCACWKIGELFLNGKYLEADQQQAMEWFEKAANIDSDYAWKLGGMLLTGEDVEPDFQRGLKWLEKAAYSNYRLAWKLGKLFHYGINNLDYGTITWLHYDYDIERTERDDPKTELAEKWYTLAAENSWYYAAKLSEEYREDGTLPPDPQKVEQWCRKAGELLIADQCERTKEYHPIAQRVLGDYYYLQQEYGMAVEWYLKAWENPDLGEYRMCNEERRELLARMYFHLGMCYYKGLGVEEDHDTAADWFIRSASYLIDGWKNPELFMTLKSLAEDEDNAAAQYGLGICYDNGNGPERDEKLAVEWYQKAAENGDLDAQFEMGRRYLSGAGIPEDSEKGTEIIYKAAEQGYIPAIELLEENECDVTGYRRIYDRKALMYRMF